MSDALQLRKLYLPTTRGLVHAQEAGAGSRVIVFVTITSFGGALMERVLPLLAQQGWCAIALDLMGYGRSDKRTEPWLVEDFADNIEEALQVRGVQPRTLVCGHFSGWIGIEIASRRHDWLQRLVLDGTPYFSAAVRAANLAKPPAAPQAWHADGRHAFGYWKRAYGIVHRLDPDAPLPDVPSAKFREAYLAVLESLSFEPGTMDAANRFDIETKLAQVTLPVLLMCSDHDWNLPHHPTFKALLPQAEELRWSGTHPLHALDRPERAAEYAEAVGRFAATGDV